MARSPGLCANPWLCSLLPNIATERRQEAGDQEQGGVHERDAGVESFERRCTNGQPEDSVLIPVDVTATGAPLISQDRVREQRWGLPPPPATVIKQTTNRRCLVPRKSRNSQCSTSARAPRPWSRLACIGFLHNRGVHPDGWVLLDRNPSFRSSVAVRQPCFVQQLSSPVH
jgi:hypothetical protein